jgi:hypothetical protein
VLRRKIQAGIAEPPLAGICLERLLQHPKAGSTCNIRSHGETNAGFRCRRMGKIQLPRAALLEGQ